MAVFDEQRFSELITDAMRRVLREELARRPETDLYLPISDAARIAAVAPDTVRAWIAQGRLPQYHAGRELRVRRSDLEAFMAKGPAPGDSPEVLANELIAKRNLRERARGR